VTEKNLKVQHAPFTPKISVIVPCRGVDPNFKKSIHAILNQDYPDYEAIFGIASEEDPAYACLNQLIQEHPQVPSQIIIAGQPTVNTGKLNNLVHATEHLRPESEVLVFMDSDTSPHKKWIQDLIAPLQYKTVGITTGIPVYVPRQRTFWSLVKSTWMSGLGAFVTVKRFRGCYGGAMAVFRKHFDEYNVQNTWKTALTDDLTLSMALKPTGLHNYFVPQCMVPIFEGTDFINFFKWANRQSLLSRVYFPFQWTFVSLMFIIRILFMVVSPVVFFMALSAGSLSLLHWIFICPIYMAVINTLILKKAIDDGMKEEVPEIKEITRWYPVLALVTQVLAIGNFILPIFSKNMTWRGVKYRFTSRTTVEVVKHQ